VVSFVSATKPAGYYGYYAYGGNDEESAKQKVPTSITLIDYSDAHNPVIKSTLTLKDELVYWPSYEAGESSRSVVSPSKDTLVLLSPTAYASSGCSHSSTPAALVVIDVANVEHPREVTRRNVESGYTVNMVAGNNHVFVGGYGGLQILDVTNRQDPWLSPVLASDSQMVAADPVNKRVVGSRKRYSEDGNRQDSHLVLWQWNGKELVEGASIPWGEQYYYSSSAGMQGSTLALASYSGTELFQVDEHALTSLGQLPARADHVYGARVMDVAADSVSVLSGNQLRIYARTSQGVGRVLATVPLTGRGGTLLMQDDVLHVAAGYHGLLRIPLQQH